MTGDEQKACCKVLAELIRNASASGSVTGSGMLQSQLMEHEIFCGNPPEKLNMEALLELTLSIYPDIAVLTGVTGETLYHATPLLGKTYAAILSRKGSPVTLIAEEIRRNSAEYPRPLPLDIFEQTPFDLSVKEIEAALQYMAATPEFQDISFTTTSTGAVYLFSIQYLDRPYATFLAERADTGLLSNP